MHYTLDYIKPSRLSEFKAKISVDHFNSRELKINTYSDAVIVPSGYGNVRGIYDQGEHVDYSDFWNNGAEDYHGEHDTECTTPSLYLGAFFGCWGHCLSDNLRHLWPFVRKCVPAGVQYVYTTSAPDEKLPPNFLLMLRALGIDESAMIRIEKPTLFKHLCFPEPSYWMSQELGGRYWTHEFADTLEVIRSHYVKTEPVRTRKVYFTRAGWKAYKPDIGENYVEAAFREKGYEIIRPETLNFGEMLKLLAETKSFASTEGSCQLNAVFLQKGTETVIVRKAEYTEDVQIVFNQIRDLNAINIDANLSTLKMNPAAPWQGPFFMYVNERLGRFLGVKPHFPFWDYLAYLRAYVRMRGRRLLSQIRHWNFK